MRPAPGTNAGDEPSESYYIETTSGAKFSCSFVEFDGMGDYLLFDQHEHAWYKAIQLADNNPVLLVVYCHGWKNNSQSADVLRFNEFLCQLASASWVREQRFRVHGVYLAWRGASMKPARPSDGDGQLHNKMQKLFGAPIINSRWQQWLPSWAAFVPQQLTYWGRKAAAEDDVSGSPISRTIFSLAYAIQRHRTAERDHRVVLIGHSMGALMLERSLANASLSKVMTEWPWFTKLDPNDTDRAVLPFDLILLLNSAAPSIYAKEMRDFLAADYEARNAAGVPRPGRPVMISITSQHDFATGVFHPLGNLLSSLSPKLQREYYDSVTRRCIPQSYFYSRTPGHNPLLINRNIESVSLPPLASGGDPFEANMVSAPGNRAGFYTTDRDSPGAFRSWQVVKAPTQPTQPTIGASWRDKANYWIISVPKALIRDHGDIWSRQCMEMFVALWRMAQ